MNALKHLQTYLLLCGLIVASAAFQAFAQTKSEASGTNLQQNSKERDGQRDFDFEIGAWKTRLSRRLRPLTGSTTWVEYEGTTVVRKIWNGRANLVELEVDGPAGHIEGLSLRLYNPESRQWSLNFSNSAGGTLSPPTIGEFHDGRGEFYSQETLGGRTLYVRFVISDITPPSCRSEPAFSDDGGKSWEPNWIATDTRMPYSSLRGGARAGLGRDALVLEGRSSGGARDLVSRRPLSSRGRPAARRRIRRRSRPA